VAGDTAVEADVVARGAAQITAEETEAGVELLEDDGLGLNLTDLLGDDPLGHLLENEETLLDDHNRLAVADNFLLIFDNSLAGERTNKIVRAIEIVETVEGGNSSVVIERVSTSNELSVRGHRLSGNTCNEGSGNDNFNELGEHFE